ncbi:hypothetical protein [Hymenobacter latericus]|uniref:hypothetical protein n=1 Tax=Hymenobacter sp. YIM 151858-1 TaxID=2987688 RepID=UPI002226434E|nr:hypothetical protein [Hymenobacter sp. YIM 151858-1]UYZ60091.1 hypothetical protein OIS50_04645 [Hymenobacter sp. YIM 151858-1]
MSKDELKAIFAKLPLDQDKLYPRDYVLDKLPDTLRDKSGAVDYAVRQGWLCARDQFGIRELWVDGRPEWKATRFAAPRPRVSASVSAASAAVSASAPLDAEKKKPAASRKKQPAPQPVGGLFS